MKGTDIALIGVAGFALYKISQMQSQQTGTTSGGGGGFSLGGISIPGLGGGGTPSISLGGLGAADIGNLFNGLNDTFAKLLGGANPLGSGGLLDPGEYISKFLGGLTDPLAAVTDAFKKDTGDFLANATDAFKKQVQALLDKVTPESPTTKQDNSNNKQPEADTNPKTTAVGTQPVSLLENLRTELKLFGAVGAKQYVGAALAGTHLLRPLPGAKAVEGLSEIARAGAEKLAPKIAEKFAPNIAEKVGVGLIGKTASKAIPFVGWASLLIDPFADIARLYGVDVPEWLGLSPLISIFTGGQNPLESWVKKEDARSQGEKNNAAMESVSDRTTQLAQMPTPYKLNVAEAGTGRPEAPVVMAPSYFTPEEVASPAFAQFFSGGAGDW